MLFKRRRAEDVIATLLGSASLDVSQALRILELHNRTAGRDYHALRGLYEHLIDLELDYLNRLRG